LNRTSGGLLVWQMPVASWHLGANAHPVVLAWLVTERDVAERAAATRLCV
jgi:hypothetical protein